MTEHTLTLTNDQLYEVYCAAWREFVALHKQATVNSSGVSNHVLKRVRHSRTAIGQVCDMIETLLPAFKTNAEAYTTARAQAKIEVEYGVMFASTRNGRSFVMPDFFGTGDVKRYDLSKIAPFATVVPPSFRSRPSNEILEVAELAEGLHGKNFAMLSEDELMRFRHLRQFGRKYGLLVSVEVMNDGDDIQDELAAASPELQEEIYRRLTTQVAVRWFALDSAT
ncbi:hypothetical protein F3J45_28510 [Pantoea sp. Ap-967]|uniref:hypothetical protein n=1 Tax=Pantoea sp. Ap-967 TaxID=2608362 RepID=UPI0014224A0D|nr:hypothetical protein [Pantoea sp. Ap-967]NIE78374.1 hypothetical protein [Pantoea sp. Ap-967]